MKTAVQLACYKLLRMPVPGRVRPDTGPHPFDVAYGVDTTGLVHGALLFERRGGGVEAGGAHEWVTAYYGVAPSAFSSALAKLNLPWEQFTFIDIGCGKGRAMLLALQYPFREIVGVELAPALAATAEHNLEIFHAEWRCADVPTRVVVGDATRFALPGGALLLFLYHPFSGPAMHQFLATVRMAIAAEQRDVYLLYANPELASNILTTPGFEQVWREPFNFSEDDARVDRFGSTSEQFAAFQVKQTEHAQGLPVQQSPQVASGSPGKLTDRTDS